MEYNSNFNYNFDVNTTLNSVFSALEDGRILRICYDRKYSVYYSHDGQEHKIVVRTWAYSGNSLPGIRCPDYDNDEDYIVYQNETYVMMLEKFSGDTFIEAANKLLNSEIFGGHNFVEMIQNMHNPRCIEF